MNAAPAASAGLSGSRDGVKHAPIMETKTVIRQRMRQLLREVPPHAGGALVARLQQQAASWAASRIVAIFGGLRGEPDLTGAFLSWLREQGHRAVLFAIEEGRLAPREIRDDADLVRSNIGAWEPRASCPPLSIAEIDLIIVPGLAFTRDGARLGRGGGYYDRLLGRSDCRARRVGLAYDFQIVAALPVEPHDQRVHEILTESGLIPSSLPE
jgi:5-formyltetrahydrofolate cyclo-ligase